MPLRRLSLGQALLNVPLGEQELAREVVILDEVPVDDPQTPHSGPDQGAGDHRPQSSAAHQDHEPLGQALLPRESNAREDGLPRVSVEVFHAPIPTMPPSRLVRRPALVRDPFRGLRGPGVISVMIAARWTPAAAQAAALPHIPRLPHPMRRRSREELLQGYPASSH
jgi:hypothetical protein